MQLSNRVAKRVKKFVMELVILTLVAYVILCAGLYFMQDRFIFVPSREVPTDPKAYLDLDFEKVELKPSTGETVEAWFVPAVNPRGTVLYCHGNGGNIAHRFHMIEMYHDLSVNIMIFDYEGYGNSTGKPSEKALRADVEAAWGWLTETRGLEEEKIVVVGCSMGGAVASWIAKEKNPGGLILDSTFRSLPDIASDRFKFFPVNLLCRYEFATEEYAKAADCPILVMHSPEDGIVPYHHGAEIFEALDGPKQFLELKGSHANGLADTGELYIETVHNFLSEVLKRKDELIFMRERK